MKLVSALFFAINVGVFLVVTAEESRIIGGEKATRSYPYQISLQLKNKHNCGGAIITSRCIVTAAHCAKGYRKEDLSIVAGTNEWKSNNGKRYFIKTIRVHPGYVKLRSNDISVMIINSTFDEGPTIAKIKYSNKIANAGENATLTGWGYTSKLRLPPLANSLQRINLRTISNEECRRSWGQKITDNELCTKAPTGMGSCGGDSDGPLTLGDGDELIGLNSYGSEICATGYPDVFVRVSQYVSWIAKNCCA